MQSHAAKAIRCESCGAALPAKKPTCDYCGSHHNLPVWPHAAAEAPERGSFWSVLLIALVAFVLLGLAVAIWFSIH